jgi:hypothetical protein
MTKLLMIAVMLAAAGCKERSKLDKPPSPSNQPAVGNAVGSATAPPPGAEADAQAFCEKTMQKMLACFEDASFWDVLATTYFAKYPDASGNPDVKKMWIGMRKDDLVGLKRENALGENCHVMVTKNQLPTADDIKTVSDAMAKSCADFGTAMGFMLFHKGAFHTPR